MNANELQEMLNELLAAIQEVLQSGEELSDEIQGLLADTIGLMLQRIDELRSQGAPADGLPPPAPPQTPDLEPGAYPSSNVNSYKYDPTTERLFVKFHGAESAERGPTYLYQGVPRNIYDVFARGGVAPTTSGQNRYHRWIRGVTPSLGAALYHLIRQGGYPYQRVAG